MVAWSCRARPRARATGSVRARARAPVSSAHRVRTTRAVASAEAADEFEFARLEDIARAKRDVLTQLSATRRVERRGTTADVARAVVALERLGAGSASVSGTWTLAYSYKEKGGEDAALESLGVSDDVVQEMTRAAYEFFFKFAPWLAGSAETNARGVRNTQTLDIETGVVRNEVDVSVGDDAVLRIGVDGEIEAKDALARRVSVCFTGFDIQLRLARVDASLPRIAVPLPRPRGELETTFCDESMRISRGGKGGVFILTRLRDS